MSFLTFLFYLFLFILIKLGDFVYRLLLKSYNSVEKNVSRIKKRSRNSKEKIVAASHTISQKKILSFDLFSKYLRKLVKIPLTILHFAYKLSLKIIRFAFLVLISPFKLIFSVRHLFHRKKRGRKPKPIKTSIAYKFKYLFIGSVFAFFFLFIPATFLIFISDLPKLSGLSVNYIAKTTKILDRNGELLFEIYANQNRTIVPLEKVPKNLVNATIAIEDQDFYHHHGFDLKGIARAIYVDLTGQDFQGGSTITQQLMKSALLTPELTIARKAKEIALAFWAEQKYTKEQILELYFNYVPYGGTAWGVEAASQIYFGKSVSELSLSESAYLAGLPQAPSKYSPFSTDGLLGKARQKDVLNAMVEQGYINEDQAVWAYEQELDFNSPNVPIQAPHFVMFVKNELINRYGLLEVERGGLQVKTTLDLKTQELAESIVADEVDKAGSLGVGNGAALITNPQNGDILAMVGSRDYFDPEHDGNVNITTSLRQPGSTIKLVTYSLALSNGLTEATILDDSPLTIRSPGAPSYTPVNYDGRFHGKVPIRLAFANSYNIPAVRLAQKFGVSDILEMAKKMGIRSWNSPENYGLSITLGAAEVSMLELSTAYGVVANQGNKVELDPILEVRDSEGNAVHSKVVKEDKVLDPGVAFIISDILSDNRARSLSFGSNSPLIIADHKIAVKTGTTDNKRDNWTIGYTPELLIATWVGNNDNTPLSQALSSGITGAAPMWSRIMTALVEDGDSLPDIAPTNVISKPCYGYTAYFIEGTEKKDNCRYKAPTPTFQQE